MDKNYTIKSNRNIHINIEYYENSHYYFINAFDESNNKIGLICFTINCNHVWLHNIVILDEKYMNSGVGKILIDNFENICAQKGAKYVEGKFIPQNNLAREFYNRNDYTITYDDYVTLISKILDVDKILQNNNSLSLKDVIVIEKQLEM